MMRSTSSPAPTDNKDDMSLFRRQGSVTRAMPRGTQRRRANTDTVKLLMLGYRQELAREFTLFNCFGSSFTALSSLTALGGTYGIGLTYGGPVVMMWGWLVVTFFTASVGVSMAELASAYPTSGALYYWSFKLAPRRFRNLACWLTGWILTMGQAAFTASNFYTFVHLVSAAVQVQYGVVLSAVQLFLMLLAMLFVTGLLNCGSARLTAFMTSLGTLWHIVALAAFCITVPLLAPERQSAKYVFTSWQPHHEETGISSAAYTVLVGLLMTQWTLTGYDGAAHLAEETFHAEINVPRAIILTIAGVGATGYAFILALNFVKVDAAVLLDPANETGGTNVVLQILIEITKEVFGSVNGGVALFTIPIVGTFFCSYQSIANNSRMLYAFARDNGVPLAGYAKRVHPRTKAPVYGVLYMLFLTSLLATPMCFNAYVFPAVTSFAVVGCYLAYSIPVLCKLSTGRRYFLPGPFSLGPRLSYINNVVSSFWVLTVTVLFTLPQLYPITLMNLNWSAPILGIALSFSLGWYYFPKYGARHWFIGPRANLGQFQDILPSEVARTAYQKEAKEAARVAQEAEAEVLARMVSGTHPPGAAPAPSRPAGVSKISRHSPNKNARATPSVTATGFLPSAAAAAAAVTVVMSREAHSSGGSASQTIVSGSVGNRSRTGMGSPINTAVSGGKARRNSAISLLDGPASCGSHIAQLLHGSRLIDDGGPVFGGGEGRPSPADGRGVRERGARRLSVCSRPSTGRVEFWPSGFGGGGVGSGVHGSVVQERMSGFSRDRTSLMASRLMATSSATGLPLLALGAQYRHGVLAPGDGHLHSSDSGLQRGSLARLRRASVSVMTLPLVPMGTNELITNGVTLMVTPGSPYAYSSEHQQHQQHQQHRQHQQQHQPLSGRAGGMRRASLGGVDSGGSADSTAGLLMPLAQRTRDAAAALGTLNLRSSMEEADEGSGCSVDRALRERRVRQVSVCGKLVLTAQTPQPQQQQQCRGGDRAPTTGGLGAATSSAEVSAGAGSITAAAVTAVTAASSGSSRDAADERGGGAPVGSASRGGRDEEQKEE